MSSYKDLIVYQKAKSLSIDVLNYFGHTKYPYQYRFFVNQILRCVCSIGANICEGYGRHYKKNYRQFLSIARGSSFEAEYWFEIAMELKIFDNKKVSAFIEINKEIIKMLTTMMKNMEGGKQS